MSDIKSKIKAIYDRVEIAANGQRSTDNWSEPGINLSAPKGLDYWQWIEEAEKDALDAFTIHNHNLTNQVTELRAALFDILKDYSAYTDHHGSECYPAEVKAKARKALLAQLEEKGE